MGLDSAQQLWDHLAFTPDQPPAINAACVLRGKAGLPEEPGFSRTIHFEISGAARADYQYCREYRGGRDPEPHAVVRIRAIQLGSH